MVEAGDKSEGGAGVIFGWKQYASTALRAAFVAAFLCAVGINVLEASLDCGLNAGCIEIRTYIYSPLRMLAMLLFPMALMMGSSLFAYGFYHTVLFRWLKRGERDARYFIAAGCVFGCIAASLALMLGLNSGFSVAWKSRLFAHNLLPFFIVFIVYGGLFGAFHFCSLKKLRVAVPQDAGAKDAGAEGREAKKINLLSHIGTMLCASVLAVLSVFFLLPILLLVNDCAVSGAFFSCTLKEMSNIWQAFWWMALIAVYFGHVMSPLLYVLYCPIARILWIKQYRHVWVFTVLGGVVAGLNCMALLIAMGGMGGALLFWIYIICGVITGALHWLFLSYAQRRLERGKIHDTP